MFELRYRWFNWIDRTIGLFFQKKLRFNFGLASAAMPRIKNRVVRRFLNTGKHRVWKVATNEQCCDDVDVRVPSGNKETANDVIDLELD